MGSARTCSGTVCLVARMFKLSGNKKARNNEGMPSNWGDGCVCVCFLHNTHIVMSRVKMVTGGSQVYQKCACMPDTRQPGLLGPANRWEVVEQM